MTTTATAPLTFHALLETARTEALAVLCELMFPEPDTDPAEMRERRMAATTILRLEREPDPNSPEEPHSHTPAPSEGSQETTPAAPVAPDTDPRAEPSSVPRAADDPRLPASPMFASTIDAPRTACATHTNHAGP